MIEARLGDSLRRRILPAHAGLYGRRPDDVRGSTTGPELLTYNRRNRANPNPYAYGVVPDSYTEMDQLKISGQLTEDTRVYAFLMAGNTVNQEIDMTRWFNDMDVRLTNTSIENVTLTGYGTIFNEAEQMPDAATVTAVNQGPGQRSHEHPPTTPGDRRSASRSTITSPRPG